LHKGDGLTYNLRAKKALPFTSNGLLGLNLKARLLTDAEFKPVPNSPSHFLSQIMLTSLQGLFVYSCDFIFIKPLLHSMQKNRTGAVELAWTILDLRRGQDVRLKLGYEFYDKVTKPLIIYALVVLVQVQSSFNYAHRLQYNAWVHSKKINTNKSSVLESQSFSYIENYLLGLVVWSVSAFFFLPRLSNLLFYLEAAYAAD